MRVGRVIFSRGVRRTSLAEVGHGVSDSGDLARAWQARRPARLAQRSRSASVAVLVAAVLVLAATRPPPRPSRLSTTHFI